MVWYGMVPHTNVTSYLDAVILVSASFCRTVRFSLRAYVPNTFFFSPIVRPCVRFGCGSLPSSRRRMARAICFFVRQHSSTQTAIRSIIVRSRRSFYIESLVPYHYNPYSRMKFQCSIATLLAGSVAAFAPPQTATPPSTTALHMVLEKPKEKKLPKIEVLKIESDHLVHPLKEVRGVVCNCRIWIHSVEAPAPVP